MSAPNKAPLPVQVYEGRNTEDYLLQQHEYTIAQESYQIRRARLQDNDSLYEGFIKDLFPDETALMADGMLIENKFKNALHDHERLASQGKGMPKFIERGDRESDKVGARVREAICDTYWTVGGGPDMIRQLFLDYAGTGVMALSVYPDPTEPYPMYRRLDPRYCYPDYHNGKLANLLYIETIRERVAAFEHPGIGLDPDPRSQGEVDFICFYDADEVVEAYVRRARKEGERTKLYLVQRWVHKLGRVPVAYKQLASYNGAAHGFFDQLAGPMMVRNKGVRFAIDYMEQSAYSPLFAQGIENAEETPGPTTVYRADPDAEQVHLERIGPAATGSTIWSLISYMGDQEEKEATMPAARTGNLPQSQASGSFVDANQGTLQSVIVEMQDGMSELRRQLNEVCMRVDEKFIDEQKPLIRAVGRKKTYKPSKDIGGWYYHTIEYGAGAGMSKLNTDNRIENLIAARLLDRGTGMAQIDFVDDSTSIQEKIEAENIDDALMQRFATDPNTPFSSLMQVSILMRQEGLRFTEALVQVQAQVQAQEQAQQQQPQPGQGPVPPEAGAAPEGQAGLLPPPGQGETPVPQLPRAPMAQYFGAGSR